MPDGYLSGDVTEADDTAAMALALGGVVSHTAPGTPYSMMREPHARELAPFLKHSLDVVILAETQRQSARSRCLSTSRDPPRSEGRERTSAL